MGSPDMDIHGLQTGHLLKARWALGTHTNVAPTNISRYDPICTSGPIHILESIVYISAYMFIQSVFETLRTAHMDST